MTAVTLALSLDEAHALRAHLLPMHPRPEVERVKAKLEVAVDRTTLADSALDVAAGHPDDAMECGCPRWDFTPAVGHMGRSYCQACGSDLRNEALDA